MISTRDFFALFAPWEAISEEAYFAVGGPRQLWSLVRFATFPFRFSQLEWELLGEPWCHEITVEETYYHMNILTAIRRWLSPLAPQSRHRLCEEPTPGVVGAAMSFSVKAALFTALLCLANTAARGIMTRLLFYGNRINYSKGVRDAFFRTPFPARGNPKSHTHGRSAGSRSSALEHANQIARRTGYGVYSYQMSSGEAERGVRGSREYFWFKDANINPVVDEVLEQDMRVLVDVDYYIDLPSFLLEHAGPVYLYTILPEAAAYVSEEVTFCFDAQGNLKYSVKGSASYEHKLWSFDADTVYVSTVTSRSWNPLDYLWPTTTVYMVERKQVAPHRAAVLMVPKASWTGPLAWLGLVLSGRKLDRFNPVSGGYARFRVSGDNGWLMTTAPVNSYDCATIPLDLDSQIATVAQNRSTTLSPFNVATVLARWPGDAAPVSRLLAEYYNSHPNFPITTVYTGSVHEYSFEPYTATPGPKPTVVQYMKGCFLDGAYSVDKGAAGQTAAVQGRILKPAKSIAACDPFVAGCIKDFLSMFVVEGQQPLVPHDAEEVFVRQPTPSQRSILEKAVTLLEPIGGAIKTFIKAESYAKLTHPRIISQVNGKEKLELSQYIYAMADFMKANAARFPWYVSGLTPVQIAQRVVDCLKTALDQRVCLADGARLDGTINELSNDFFHALGCLLFRADAFPEFVRLMDAMISCHCEFAKGPDGKKVSYDSLWARLSGAPTTSIFNTIWTAFGCYLALRKQYAHLGAEEAHRRAWAGLGGNLGDDAICHFAEKVCWDFASQATGIDFEIDDCAYGMKVSFLARIFSPDAWTGCLDSVCDFRRTLGKFHVVPATADNSSPEFKLISRCLGLVTADANTPVIGDICKLVFELTDRDIKIGKITAEFAEKGFDLHAELKDGRVMLQNKYGPMWKNGYMSWFSTFDMVDQWPNKYGEWMSHYVREECRIDVSKFLLWKAKFVDLRKTLKDFMDTAPLLVEPGTLPPPVAPVVCNGMVRYPDGYTMQLGNKHYKVVYSKVGSDYVSKVEPVTVPEKGYVASEVLNLEANKKRARGEKGTLAPELAQPVGTDRKVENADAAVKKHIKRKKEKDKANADKASAEAAEAGSAVPVLNSKQKRSLKRASEKRPKEGGDGASPSAVPPPLPPRPPQDE